MNLPDAVKKVSEKLAEWPSIGPRQATRLAFYLVGRGGRNLDEMIKGLTELSKVKLCAQCYFLHQNENNLCDICSNPKRKQNVIAIVEKETDLISIENTNKFTGRYLVIGPVAKTGILENWQKSRLKTLTEFIAKKFGGTAEEIILAFNPTANGDFNSSILIKELSAFTKKITRLGRGLPMGGEIEFADDETLGEALSKRS